MTLLRFSTVAAAAAIQSFLRGNEMRRFNTVNYMTLIFSSALLTSAAWGDPLPGQILKFQQSPMIATPITDTTGTTNTYFGHDELSTAWN
jgi:hypothetical protein